MLGEGFSEMDKDEVGNKKSRVDKNRRHITQERISRFLSLQFASFMKGINQLLFSSKTDTK